ncbi:hypothetical protein KUTeg_000613 [Tegillarca granosa]|uniref:Copper type II ascorbate-dependent monooxygenase C-terminal domain-containing protein n=1 Tax=Tegillarca granosa TaxID=220873 RepID=A0ABQ9FZ32_TEGGR|nr:hypothetical protein KUTeg_000613 [Tegillarca granosa]
MKLIGVLKARDISLQNMKLTYGLKARDISLQNMKLTYGLKARDISLQNMKLTYGLKARDISLQNIKLTNGLKARDISLQNIKLTNGLKARDISLQNIKFTNGLKARDISLQNIKFKEPLRVYPGDTLKTTCEYNSMNRSKPVPSGFSSYEEMCAAVLTYYPKEAWKSKICASYKNIPLCTVWTTGKIKDCDIEQFRKMAKFYRSFTPVLTNCAKTGKCSSTCLMATKVARKHRCMKGEMYHMWKSLMEFNKRVVYRDSDPVFEELLNAFVACEAEYDRTVPA